MYHLTVTLGVFKFTSELYTAMPQHLQEVFLLWTAYQLTITRMPLCATFCVWVITLELWHSFCRHSVVCKCHYRNICFLNFLFLLSYITCLVCSVCLAWVSERESSTFTFCFCSYWVYANRWQQSSSRI
jgi:hypothetical protein